LWDLAMCLSIYLPAEPRTCCLVACVCFFIHKGPVLQSGMTFYTGSDSTQSQSRHL
jgi:hypothetical protein